MSLLQWPVLLWEDDINQWNIMRKERVSMAYNIMNWIITIHELLILSQVIGSSAMYKDSINLLLLLVHVNTYAYNNHVTHTKHQLLYIPSRSLAVSSPLRGRTHYPIRIEGTMEHEFPKSWWHVMNNSNVLAKSPALLIKVKPLTY